jgi:hypothetical protein
MLPVHRARTTFEDTERTLRWPSPSEALQEQISTSFGHLTPARRVLGERVIHVLITHTGTTLHPGDNTRPFRAPKSISATKYLHVYTLGIYNRFDS